MLNLDAVCTAQFVEHGIVRVDGQGHAGHAPDGIAQAAVLCAAVRAAQKDDGGRREQDTLQGSIAFGFGESKELQMSDQCVSRGPRVPLPP